MKKTTFNNIWQLLVMVLLLSSIFSACGDNNPTIQDRAPINRNRDSTIVTNFPGFFENYESTNRGIWQKPNLILDLLGDLSDKTIADIGAGTGFLTRQIIPKAKKVIAIDIDPRFIDHLDSIKNNSLIKEFQDRLETRLAQTDNPNLKKGEVDVVIIVNTYMYIEDRIDYLKILRQGLAENGRLLIIDFKKKNTPVGPPIDIRTPLYEVEKELAAGGFQNIETNDTALDYQYIVMAKK